MIIKILSSGCNKCLALGENAKAAAKAMGKEAQIIKVTVLAEIVSYGIISTLDLAIDVKRDSAGKVHQCRRNQCITLIISDGCQVRASADNLRPECNLTKLCRTEQFKPFRH